MVVDRFTRRRALSAGLVLATGLGGCTGSRQSNGGTPTTSDPERSFPIVFSDAENSSFRPGTVGPGSDSTVRWRREVLPDLPFVPLVRGDLVYATGSDHSTVHALDVESGSERWSESFDGSGLSVVLAGRSLYAFTGAALHELDAVDGTERSSRDLGFERPGPQTPHDGSLYTITAEPDTGRDVLLSFDVGGGVDWQHPTDWRLTSFAVGPERIYASSIDPEGVVAVDRASGERAWRIRTETGSTQLYAPTLDEDRIYVGGQHFEHLYAFDAATGDRLWRSKLRIPSGASLTGDGLVASGAGTLARLDRETGEKLWQRGIDGTLTFRPLVAADTVFVTNFVLEDSSLDGSSVYAVDPTSGETKWRVQTDGRLWTPPVVAGEYLFGAFGDGSVFALGAS